MNLLPHLAARLLGVPLAIHRPKLDVILSVLGSRVGLAELSEAPGYTAPVRVGPLATPQVAVIPIHGTLVRRTVGLQAQSGLTSYTELSLQLDAALANPEVAAIVLDIDSPGGESGGVFDLAERIRAASRIKPVWAVANDMAFSAAYALASAASRLIVSRTGGVGSIGVIAMHVDQSVRDQQDGVAYTAVFAGARKNDLNPHAPLSDQAQAGLQAEVDRIYELFVTTVARHRGLSVHAVKNTQAALYFGADALAAGLADDIGTLEDAVGQIQSRLLPPTAGEPRALTRSPSPETHLQQDPPMNPSTQSAQTAQPAPNTNASTQAVDSVGSVDTTIDAAFGVSDAIEIAQSCSLAGRTDLIAGFLEAKVPPAQVRSQLLSAKAQQSQDIVSRIDPNAAAMRQSAASDPASPDNPLIAAVKARLSVRAPAA